MSFSELFKAAESDLLLQKDLYKPTSFWREASEEIGDQIIKHGISTFRSQSLPLDFFVPTYGFPGNGLDSAFINDTLVNSERLGVKAHETIRRLLSGYEAAKADYRTLVAGDDTNILPYLHTFTESDYGKPIETFEFGSKKYSRSSLNYLLGLLFLKKHINCDSIKIVMEIGGGFGSLGEVLYYSGVLGCKYIDIDIPPISIVAQYYLENVYGVGNLSTYEQTKDLNRIQIDQLKAASVLNSWQIEKISGSIDLFVNYVSFQEMEPKVVANYLNHARRLETKWILLRNLREGKQIKKAASIGVEIPILKSDYISMLPNYDLVVSDSFTFGYETVDGFHSELMLFARK